MKQLLRKRIGLIVICAMFLSLVLNFAFQSYIVRDTLVQDTHLLFKQITNVLQSNVHEEELVKQEFQDNCLAKANLAADYLVRNPQNLHDVDVLRLYAKTLDVDEIHIFDATGTIISGTNPQYYGMSFNDGLQISYFYPMLEDKSLHMFQDIFPNTAEKKTMIYAAVWDKQGKNIVQVGMYPKRYLDIVERNNISQVFGNIMVDGKTTVLAIDKDTEFIVGSTNEQLIGRQFHDIGFEKADMQRGQNGIMCKINGHVSYAVFSSNTVKTDAKRELVLCRYIPSRELYQQAVYTSLMLFVYLVLLGLAGMTMTVQFLDREVVDSINKIDERLTAITKGNLDLRLHVNNLPEFAHLSKNINEMVNTLLDVTNKMFAMCSKANLPLGFYEYYASMDRVVVTRNVGKLLHISDEEFRKLTENKELFEAKLDEIRSELVNPERNIYKLPWAEGYVRMEVVKHKKGLMGIIVDKTSDYLEKQALEYERDRDAMTGLYTRRKFYREMQRLLSVPGKVGHAALVFVDANGLKKINDGFGHEAGDSYLCQISAMLTLHSTANSLLCRFGGDEFLLFVYGCADKKSLEAVLEALQHGMEHNTMVINGEAVPVSSSLGVAIYGDDGCSLNELIKLADARMYHNKMQFHRDVARD